MQVCRLPFRGMRATQKVGGQRDHCGGAAGVMRHAYA